MEKAKILQRLIEESGYSVNKVAKLAGIPQSTLATMLKKGVGKAGIDGVSNVCKVLGITLDDLINLSNGQNPSNNDQISVQEKTHLKKYRQLPEAGKQVVDNMIDVLLEPHTIDFASREVYRVARSDDDHGPTTEKRTDMSKLKMAPKVTSEDDL